MNRITLTAAGLLLIAVALLPADEPKSPEEQRDAVLKLFADEFVTITPGKGKFPAKFIMGSEDKDAPDHEKPAHEVTLSAPFGVAKYEVTQELYQAVMGNNPSKWQKANTSLRNAVDSPTWEDAVAFCQKATQMLRERKLLPEGDVIRLPSEAEWEYFCRAGTTTAYSFGDSADDLKLYSWFKGNSKGEDPAVGKKKPNPWGLYDIHGYGWEWCQDDWTADYNGAPTDGSARVVKDAKEKVLRGGSWADAAETHRSAYRHHLPPTTKSDTIGFRCVRTLKKGVSE